MVREDPGLKLQNAILDDNFFLFQELVRAARPALIRKVNTTNGWPVLFYAIQHHRMNMVNFLLDRGVDDDLLSKDYTGNTALMISAEYKNEEAAEEYLKRYPKALNMRNKEGKTALMFACKNGLEMLVNMLLDRGARIDEADNDGCTALHYASAWNHFGTVALLVNRGCSFAAQNKKGWNALDYAYSDTLKTFLQELVRSAFDTKKRPRGQSSGSSNSMTISYHNILEIVQ
ncbi:ankyrin repeat-containing domain protein [Paraphysoderma sedebokerense]|nr:ankyrin repeat-containing domain protein [Paraphysoderma sedebokerense]